MGGPLAPTHPHPPGHTNGLHVSPPPSTAPARASPHQLPAPYHTLRSSIPIFLFLLSNRARRRRSNDRRQAEMGVVGRVVSVAGRRGAARRATPAGVPAAPAPRRGGRAAAAAAAKTPLAAASPAAEGVSGRGRMGRVGGAGGGLGTDVSRPPGRRAWRPRGVPPPPAAPNRPPSATASFVSPLLRLPPAHLSRCGRWRRGTRCRAPPRTRHRRPYFVLWPPRPLRATPVAAVREGGTGGTAGRREEGGE